MRASTESLRTRRFETTLAVLAIMFVLSVVGLVLRSDPVLLGMMLGNVLTFGAAAVGFGTWHDRTVRTTQAQAEVTIRRSRSDASGPSSGEG